MPAQTATVDQEAVDRLVSSLVSERRPGVAPLDWWPYLVDREELLQAALDEVRRRRWSLLIEAVGSGMKYQQIGDRLGVSKVRVGQLIEKAKKSV